VVHRRYLSMMGTNESSSEISRGEFWDPPPGCWLKGDGGVSGAQSGIHRCPLPVTFQGQFDDGQGRLHNVESCVEHLAELILAVPVEGGGLRTQPEDE
jgi:hypothetical protein